MAPTGVANEPSTPYRCAIQLVLHRDGAVDRGDVRVLCRIAIEIAHQGAIQGCDRDSIVQAGATVGRAQLQCGIRVGWSNRAPYVSGRRCGPRVHLAPASRRWPGPFFWVIAAARTKNQAARLGDARLALL